MGRPITANLINWDQISLGTKPDKLLAIELGVSQPAVRMQRIKKGISVYKEPDKWDKSLLGIITDADIARKYGLSESTIREARINQNISKAVYIRKKKPQSIRLCVICGEKITRPRFRSPVERTTCNLPRPCRNQFVCLERLPNWNNIRGASNYNWKGGVCHSWGYVYLKKDNHPRSYRGYVKRATLVLESKIGRLLNQDEIAHHIDRNRSNDSPENLELMKVYDHSILHLKDAWEASRRIYETVNKRFNV